MQNENKSNVLLTELVIAVLFFSLIAVTITQVFVGSHQKSRLNARTQRALMVAEDWVEALSGEADLDEALTSAGFLAVADGVYERTDGLEANALLTRALLHPEQTSAAGRLLEGEISILDVGHVRPGAEEPAVLVTLPLASYMPREEVLP